MRRLTLPSSIAAWAVIVAIGAMATVGATACGEDEPPPEAVQPTPTVEAAAPSPTPEPSPTVVPLTATPTTAPVATATPTTTPTATPTPTVTPTPTPSPTATATPTPTPTPSPTPSPTPTATPSPTPTPERTAALDASDFDLSRLREALASNPPETLRLTQELEPSSAGGGISTVTVEFQISDTATQASMAFGFEGQESSFELLMIGDKQYLRGVDAEGTASPWLSSTISDGEPTLIQPLVASELLDDLIPDDASAQIEAVGIEDCGGGRQCFVLTSPGDTTARLLVDTETYLPVSMSGRAVDEESGEVAEFLLEWNPEVTISAPAEAEQVSPDEFALALFSFLLGAAGVAESPAPSPVGGAERTVTVTVTEDREVVREVPAETIVSREVVREVPVETIVTVEVVREVPPSTVVTTERSAFWLAFGASLHGEAFDDFGDLFHADPGISSVRFDPAVDIWSWGVGSIELAETTARELFGPDGELPCGSLEPVVACGANGVDPGTYLLVWSEMLDPVPLDDPAYVRTYWAMFQDGDPANDFEAPPQFANDVLGGSDTHYWLAAIPGGWELRRTFGPQLEPVPTDGAAMILSNVVMFWVPVSELGDLDTLSLGVASFSGPAEDPFGVDGALDRSPEPQQPLTPLGEVGF